MGTLGVKTLGSKNILFLKTKIIYNL